MVANVAQRWSGIYSFHWAPVLTFAKRRELALEWIEQHMNVRSYLDREHEFGVGVDRKGLRLVVRKGGFDLLLGAPELEVGAARALLEGVLTVFMPRRLHISGARMLWSAPLAGSASDVASAAASALVVEPDGFHAFDFATLLDTRTPGAHIQVEYGVVDPLELRTRLTRTDMGRIRTAEMPAVADLPSEFPEASIFCDVSWITSTHDMYGGDDVIGEMCDYLDSRVELAEHEARQLVLALTGSMRAGGADELGRGA